MAILVTGGAGYIGSHMVQRLVDDGARVVVVDDLSTGSADRLSPVAELVVGNVGDDDLISDIVRDHRVEAILHFAGSIVVADSVADPISYYTNNTAHSCRLIRNAARAGVKAFVFSSTAAVYGNPNEDRLSENAPTSPVSPYGRSKLFTEMILRDSGAAYQLGYIALRYFNVAGADPLGRIGHSRGAATHLIRSAVETALGRRAALDVYGADYPTFDGTCIRDYIHVSDLIDAHVRSLRHLLGGGDSLTLNCGYGRGSSVLQVVEAVKRVSGVDFTVRIVDRRPGDAIAVVADSDLIRRRLGWSPKWDDLEVIVRHTLEWEKRMANSPGCGR